jgi:hypothetical protein
MEPKEDLVAVISMKLRFAAAVAFLLGMFIVCSGLAYAEELKGTVGSINALNSGYAITRWPPSGGIFLVGEELTVRACTTEYPDSVEVVFRWHLPNGTSVDSDPQPLVPSGDTWNGKPIWDAYDTRTLDLFGDYGIQALFLNTDGDLQGPHNPYIITDIRAISGHAVPEIPFGTIATIVAMIAALGVFVIKKKDLAS